MRRIPGGARLAMILGLVATLGWVVYLWLESGRLSGSAILVGCFYVALYARVMWQHRRAEIHDDGAVDELSK